MDRSQAGTLQKRPWLSTKTNTSAGSKAKCRKVKTDQTKSVYPVFDECVELTPDPFWKSIFSRHAKGKTLTGFTFRDGVITQKTKKNNPLDIDIKGIEAYEVLALCQEFFKITLGYSSDLDAKNDQERIKRANEQKSTQSTKWEEVRKNNYVRYNLLSKYVSRTIEEMELGEKESCDLKTVIQVGFLLKRFDDKTDIDLEIIDNKLRIKIIHGIKYDLEKGFYIDDETHPLKQKKRATRTTTTAKKKEEEPKKVCTYTWIKYLTELKKSRDRTTFTSSIMSSPAFLSTISKFSASIDPEHYEGNIEDLELDDDEVGFGEDDEAGRYSSDGGGYGSD